jgi:hypothetical protein
VLLGSRAFDILAALVELPGEVVGKEDSYYYSRPKAFGAVRLVRRRRYQARRI